MYTDVTCVLPDPGALYDLGTCAGEVYDGQVCSGADLNVCDTGYIAGSIVVDCSLANATQYSCTG